MKGRIKMYGTAIKTQFSEYIWQDKAIRAAIGGCSAEEFRKVLTEMYEKETEMSQCWSINVGCCEMMVSLILSVLRRQDKLKAFYEVKRNAVNSVGHAEYAKYSLLISCLNNDDKAAEYIIENALCFSDIDRLIYFTHPLYILMLTGKYYLIPAVLKKVNELCFREFLWDVEESEKEDNGFRFFGASSVYSIASAAYFGDREFLKAVFDNGYSIDGEMVQNLYFEPKALEFIISNFYDKMGLDKPLGIYEAIKEKFGTEEILGMAIKIRSMYGNEEFDNFSEGIRPMKKTNELSSSIIFLYSPPLLWPETGMEAYFMRDSAEKELTVSLSRGENRVPFYDAERIFPDHSITYDMTNINDERFLVMLSNKDLKDTLVRRVIFNKSFAECVVREILNRNSRQLTRLLIEKEMINKDNYEEILDYAVSQKLLDVLAVLHSSSALAAAGKE